MKKKYFQVAVSEGQWAWLKAEAKRSERSVPGVVRWLIEGQIASEAGKRQGDGPNAAA